MFSVKEKPHDIEDLLVSSSVEPPTHTTKFGAKKMSQVRKAFLIRFVSYVKSQI